ncbi:MAG: deoxyribodipyrimidine photolyase [Legionellales bacterium]|jgi:deoxyribodipyrimidine photo-lyase|nr:deoxyribodipyrimidine photolyase [Legionellales bacterium]
MSEQPLVLHIFTHDMRLSDNSSLFHAAKTGRVWPIFIDDHADDPYPVGGASRWWLYQSLRDLHTRLDGGLSIFTGSMLEVVSDLIARFPIQGVFWNHRYDAYHRRQADSVTELLRQKGIAARSFNGSLLWEPWSVRKDDGTPYKVFTPFYRKGCLKGPTQSRCVESAPSDLHTVPCETLDPGVPLDKAGILPSGDWHQKFEPLWQVGEQAAQTQLQRFLDDGLSDYKKGRDFPAKRHVSMLSPYLRHGNISASQVHEAIGQMPPDVNTDHFCSELGWREFSYYLLYHFQDLPCANLQKKFDRFPWSTNDADLRAWQQGQTGIPIVDAGMRQLWQTGYMHNRLRMIVGSFLVKNLGHHWVEGEKWFRHCLVDHDLASNSASWQWVAGCGTDAAPYFRIFNPVTQGQRFDPTGEFTRKYVPELQHLPDDFLFNPWDAPVLVLQVAEVGLGTNYPRPIVDLKQSREQALEKFKRLSS